MRHLLVLSLSAIAAASQAADFSMSGLALSNTGTLALTATGDLHDAGFPNNTYYAGPFRSSLDGGATSFRTFCGDLLHHAEYNVGHEVTVKDAYAMGANYALAAKVLNKYYGQVGDDAQKNAALQGAIWKAIYGDDLTLGDGTSGASALANTYLTSDLSGVSPHAYFFDTMGKNQGQMAPVPEPASMAALGLGALGLLKRRKSR